MSDTKLEVGDEVRYVNMPSEHQRDAFGREPTEMVGTVVDIVEETKHVGVSSTIEQTLAVIEGDGEEKRVNVDYHNTEIDGSDGGVTIQVLETEDDDDDDTEEAECPECGKTCASEHGVAVHRGKAHGDDETEESGDEADTNAETADQTVAADGGRDNSEHVDDDTIRTAIKQHDDPDHPGALSVADVRDLLAHVQTDAEVSWLEWCDNIERNDIMVVAQDGDTIVLDSGETDAVSRALETYNGPVTVDDVARRVVSTVHHRRAESIDPEYNWGVTYPYVIRLPADGEKGQQFTEAVVNGLQRRGLSPGQAWAYYGVEIRGESRNSWGKRKGDRDHKNVSDALEKAKAKL